MFEEVRVLAADVMKGNVIIHFSDGSSVLFQAHFLSEVRTHDHNIPLEVDADDNLDPE